MDSQQRPVQDEYTVNRLGCVLYGWVFGWLLLACPGGVPLAGAADLAETQQLLFAGKYDECRQIASDEFARGVWNEGWPALLLRCQLTTGRYAEARETYDRAIAKFKDSIGLRLLGYDVYRYNNQPRQAIAELDTIFTLVKQATWRYSSAADRVVLGRYFTEKGEDARQILELFYDRAKKSNPRLVDVYLANAELALDKHDNQVAADSLAEAVKLQPEDPYVHYLLARVWRESDSERATAALQQALSLNPRHVPSLLMQADHLIDAEQYELAAEILTQVLAVNLFQPEAWAYHAIIAHLQGHAQGEQALRAAALDRWASNPLVDHWIGTKLSQKYRFAEGAAYQRRALDLQPGLLDAKFQLAQDLLRLGQDSEGWRLAREVNQADAYNVVAYNLVTLRDSLQKFATVENEHFVIRMDAREARIYGQQALALLEEARQTLCAKYDVQLGPPTIVEIFPQQKDFAIRTFGLPGGAGFLGVCFGRVITANSPASQGESPSNWQSVLWHEFCHVVTLSKTNNKMPRWLSEGISVYEERQHNPSWGEQLTAPYRELLLRSDLTPVSQLSSAFLRPPSPLHLQFAYYESSLVVEFLMERHGLPVMQRLLTDLGVGMPINEALERYTGSLAALDDEFAKFARQRAAEYGSALAWDPIEGLDRMPRAEVELLYEKHPHNYHVGKRLAALLMAERDWDRAATTLQELVELFPGDRSTGSPLTMLAAVYRQQSDTEREELVLRQLGEMHDDTVDIYKRLLEVDAVKQDWPSVSTNAHRLLAVNPLLPIGQEMLAKSAGPLQQPQELAGALRALLEMNPVDPARLQFELAQALQQIGDLSQAKRHLLMAIEEAPRYRAAQEMLLQLVADAAADSGLPEGETEASAGEKAAAFDEPDRGAEAALAPVPEATSDPVPEATSLQPAGDDSP